MHTLSYVGMVAAYMVRAPAGGRRRAASRAIGAPCPGLSVGRVERRPLLGGQLQVHRGQALVELRDRGGADQLLALPAPGPDQCGSTAAYFLNTIFVTHTLRESPAGYFVVADNGCAA